MAKENLLVMDIGRVVMREKTNDNSGRIIASSTISSNTVTSSLSQDFLRADWGGGIVATIESEKTVELSFTDVFFSLDYLAVQQGTDVEDGATGRVLTSSVVKVVDNASNLEVTVPSGVTATEFTIEDKTGKQTSGLLPLAGTIDLPVSVTAVEGDEVTLWYLQEITGQKVEIDSAKLPKYYEIQFHTRAFDPVTNEVTKDIYVQFDKVKPNGQSDMNLEVSSAVSTEMSFTALNASKDTTSMGRYFVVDRV